LPSTSSASGCPAFPFPLELPIVIDKLVILEILLGVASHGWVGNVGSPSKTKQTDLATLLVGKGI
jgi:hypothetical protein